MRRRRIGPEASGCKRINRRVYGGETHDLSTILDIESGTLKSGAQSSEIYNLAILPQGGALLRTASQWIYGRCTGSTCGPALRINRGGMAPIHTRKRTEISENAILPAEGVSEEAARATGVGDGRGGPAHDDS